MAAPPLTLRVLPGAFTVCRLEPGDPVPGWAVSASFCSVTRTPHELSVVCPEEAVPAGLRAEGGWACLGVEGPLEFALTGVLVSLAGPLAEAGVSVFAVSTFDTDYLLVKRAILGAATAALKAAGHRIRPEG